MQPRTQEKRKAGFTNLKLSDSTKQIRLSLEGLKVVSKPMLNVFIMDDLSIEIKTVAKEFSANVDEQYINYYFAFNGVEAVEKLKDLFSTCEGDFIIVADFDMVGYARRFLRYQGPESNLEDPAFLNSPYNGGYALCMLTHAFKLEKARRGDKLGKLQLICHSGTPRNWIEASLTNNAISESLRPNFVATFRKGINETRLVRDAMEQMGYHTYLVPEKKVDDKCLEFLEQVKEREKSDLKSLIALRHSSANATTSLSPPSI